MGYHSHRCPHGPDDRCPHGLDDLLNNDSSTIPKNTLSTIYPLGSTHRTPSTNKRTLVEALFTYVKKKRRPRSTWARESPPPPPSSPPSSPPPPSPPPRIALPYGGESIRGLQKLASPWKVFATINQRGSAHRTPPIKNDTFTFDDLST